MTPQGKKQLEPPVPEEVSLPTLFEGQETGHLLEPLIILAKHKFLILYIVGATAVGSLILALVLPNYYTANAKLLPPQQGQSFASAMLDQLGALGPLLGAAGGKDLLKNPNDLYVAMLHSRTVADSIIDRFSLMSVYGKRLREDARKKLDSRTEITARKDGVISISVEDRDPRRAAAMANAYTEELEKLTKRLAVTDAGKRRMFFERESKVANDDLAAAEQTLRTVEEKTGFFQLDSQAKVMLEGYAELRAQVSAKEAEVQAMRSFATSENPDLLRAEHELAALRTQVAHYEKGQGGRPVGDIALEKIPTRALEYVRQLREVKYRESLLQLLLKQYEIARIDEAKDANLVQVLDQGLPPEKKSWPKLTFFVLIPTLLSLLISIFWVYGVEAMDRANQDPQHLARLHLLKFYLARRSKSQP